MSETEERIVMKTYPFKLTDKDYIEKGKLAAKQQLELANIEDQFKEVKEEWKHKIKMQTLDLKHSLRVIRNGEEEREVECTEVKDFKRLTVSYVFEGEILEERAMTEKERQLVMNFETAKKNAEVDNVVPMSQEQREIRDVIRGETNAKTKKDLLQ